MFFDNSLFSTKLPIIRALTINLLFGLSFGPAFALDCPAPQLGSQAGTIKESSDDIKNLSKRLMNNGQENVVKEVALELKNKYPAATTGEIVNYLVSAYCPGVNQKTGLSDVEKSRAVEKHIHRVFCKASVVPANNRQLDSS